MNRDSLTRRQFMSRLGAAALIMPGLPALGQASPQLVPQEVRRGQCIAYPGAWAFQPHVSMVLVSDQELIDLATQPDKVLNLATGFEPRPQSLRQACEAGQRRGADTLAVFFDGFFAQYRPGLDHARRLTPDMDEYVGYIARIGKFAKGYGMRLELSLLTPLEIGQAYNRQTGESGRWLHYRKGLRDPKSGAYSVELWQQRRWVNNKGIFDIEPAGVRVFAFRERRVGGGPYRAVDEASIVELSGAQTEIFEGIAPPGGAAANLRRIRVFGKGQGELGSLDRVLVVQQYKSPEMDYFSASAPVYLRGLLDKYFSAGVEFSGFYSDEMHIQQDWGYFGHHDHGQFAMRYVSPGLERRFAEKYGAKYRDLAKYMVYFAYGQEDAAADLTATEGVQHVFGAGAKAIQETALFRSRYYEMLQDGVVDLFVGARRYAEGKTGRRLYTRAHATWAQSPTIDSWRSYGRNGNSQKYEYTPNFVWSNTVHQAAAACHDYFKWGEYLTGNGNDHSEGGWLDRNYYGLMLACSTGIINEIPYSYGAHWGSPPPITARRAQVANVFGAGGAGIMNAVTGMQHRDVEVLMLYPLDLVAAEERFGSWMAQYAYANLVTPAKLLELGKVENGAIVLGGRRFTTLVATFEPFPRPGLLEMMRQLAEAGGRVIWSGPPPLLGREGKSVREAWQLLFGVDCPPTADGWGLAAPGGRIAFEGAFKGIEAQMVLTDFLVDRLYPLTCREGSQPVARWRGQIVGTLRRTPAGGALAALGFRPRDDQSASLGYETRGWFEMLNTLGAYPAAKAGAGAGAANDNPSVVSRTTPYLACRFPNGATALAPHLKDVEEQWEGGFARNAQRDEEVMKRITLPSNTLALKGFRVNGHVVDYEGEGALAFRTDARGNLIAFAGQGARTITVDGRTFELGRGEPGPIGWAPVEPERRVAGGAVLLVSAARPGTIAIPAGALEGPLEFFAEGALPGSKGRPVPSRREGERVLLDVPRGAGRWIYGIPAA